jgi:hypothetical protein
LIDKGVYLPGINTGYVGVRPTSARLNIKAMAHLECLPSARDHARRSDDLRSERPTDRFIQHRGADRTPSSNLIVNLAPLSIAPPGAATLIVTSSASISTPTWYTIPVPATSTGITQTIGVNLLVGGERVYLPIIRK